MHGGYYPNREPWGLLECGCVVGMEFSVKAIGQKKKGWFNECRNTGEWERVITENVAWQAGECRNNSRLF